MWLTFQSEDFELTIHTTLYNWVGLIQLVEGFKRNNLGSSKGGDSSFRLLLDSRVQHQLLWKFPACWTALRILELPDMVRIFGELLYKDKGNIYNMKQEQDAIMKETNRTIMYGKYELI